MGIGLEANGQNRAKYPSSPKWRFLGNSEFGVDSVKILPEEVIGAWCSTSVVVAVADVLIAEVAVSALLVELVEEEVGLMVGSSGLGISSSSLGGFHKRHLSQLE